MGCCYHKWWLNLQHSNPGPWSTLFGFNSSIFLGAATSLNLTSLPHLGLSPSSNVQFHSLLLRGNHLGFSSKVARLYRPQGNLEHEGSQQLPACAWGLPLPLGCHCYCTRSPVAKRITLNIAGWEQWLLLPTVESTLEGGSSDLQPSQEQLHQGAKTFWERSHFPVATCFAFVLLHLCKAILSSGLTEFLISSSDIPQKHESLEGFGVP